MAVFVPTPSHRVGAFCGHGPGHPREKDTYDVHNKDAAAVTGTRAHSGETRKFSVCTGTQNDQMILKDCADRGASQACA